MAHKRKVCIVGIRGEMGDWFRRHFHATGEFSVCGTGRAVPDGPRVAFDTDASGELLISERGLEQTVRASEIVVLSTPLLETPAIIRRFAAWSGPGQIWCDLASIKGHIFEDKAYDAVQAAEICTIHPIFAGHPRTGPVSPAGRLFVFCRVRGEAGYALLRDHFAAAGAHIVETTWQQHDRYMAVVQGLTHLNAIALGLALSSLGMTGEEVSQFASPVYKLFATISERVLSRNEELYAGIQFANRGNVDVIDAYIAALRSLADTIRPGPTAQSLEAFRALFERARAVSTSGSGTRRSEETDRILELLSRSE